MTKETPMEETRQGFRCSLCGAINDSYGVIDKLKNLPKGETKIECWKCKYPQTFFMANEIGTISNKLPNKEEVVYKRDSVGDSNGKLQSVSTSDKTDEYWYMRVKPYVEKMKEKYPKELYIEGFEPALTGDIAQIVKVFAEKEVASDKTWEERFDENYKELANFKANNVNTGGFIRGDMGANDFWIDHELIKNFIKEELASATIKAKEEVLRDIHECKIVTGGGDGLIIFLPKEKAEKLGINLEELNK